MCLLLICLNKRANLDLIGNLWNIYALVKSNIQSTNLYYNHLVIWYFEYILLYTYNAFIICKSNSILPASFNLLTIQDSRIQILNDYLYRNLLNSWSYMWWKTMCRPHSWYKLMHICAVTQISSVIPHSIKQSVHSLLQHTFKFEYHVHPITEYL